MTCDIPPFFSAQFGIEEGIYYNVGIGIAGVPEEEVDVGRMAVTEDEADWAAFKVPSLRNIAKSSPYFHDGSISDLEQAVRYMAGPGVANKNLTPLLVDRGLTDDERGLRDAHAVCAVAGMAEAECHGVVDSLNLRMWLVMIQARSGSAAASS